MLLPTQPWFAAREQAPPSLSRLFQIISFSKSSQKMLLNVACEKWRETYWIIKLLFILMERYSPKKVQWKGIWCHLLDWIEHYRSEQRLSLEGTSRADTFHMISAHCKKEESLLWDVLKTESDLKWTEVESPRTNSQQCTLIKKPSDNY